MNHLDEVLDGLKKVAVKATRVRGAEYVFVDEPNINYTGGLTHKYWWRDMGKAHYQAGIVAEFYVKN